MRKKRDSSYRTDWPPERVATLVTLWNSGLTSYQVADALSTTRSACMGKLWRLGRLGCPRSFFSAIPPRRKVDSGLDLLDLSSHHCRWPSGNRAPYSFCGRPRVGDGVYCKEHAAIAYRHSARAA